MTDQNIFSALSDTTRRQIFEALVQSPRSVGVLAEAFPVSRSAVSQHLKILSDADLIEMQRSGTRNIYHVNPKKLAELRTYFDTLWTDSLEAFQTYMDGEQDDH